MKSIKTSSSKKVECLNPNTGGSMNIDSDIYDVVSKAIYHTLKAGKSLTFTELEEGVNDCFKKQKTKFERSVGWYTVTVKNDMLARGLIEAYTEKGKKLNRLR